MTTSVGWQWRNYDADGFCDFAQPLTPDTSDTQLIEPSRNQLSGLRLN
ncbi:MAG: hypothetical protein AAGH78_01530 [Cyanobacteria bacterium P01_H01_bin.58]